MLPRTLDHSKLTLEVVTAIADASARVAVACADVGGPAEAGKAVVQAASEMLIDPRQGDARDASALVRAAVTDMVFQSAEDMLVAAVSAHTGERIESDMIPCACGMDLQTVRIMTHVIGIAVNGSYRAIEIDENTDIGSICIQLAQQSPILGVA